MKTTQFKYIVKNSKDIWIGFNKLPSLSHSDIMWKDASGCTGEILYPITVEQFGLKKYENVVWTMSMLQYDDVFEDYQLMNIHSQKQVTTERLIDEYNMLTKNIPVRQSYLDKLYDESKSLNEAINLRQNSLRNDMKRLHELEKIIPLEKAGYSENDYYVYHGEPASCHGLEDNSYVLYWSMKQETWKECKYRELASDDCWMKQPNRPIK